MAPFGESAVENNLRKSDIIEALKRVGLRGGESLLLHSSLRSMGTVNGGADALIDAFLETLGTDGTLMVPTFNYSVDDYFDPRETPSRTGAITECLRNRKQAVRSLHPTHSVATIGAKAAQYTEGHEEVGAFGINSPIDKLAKAGGHTLLLGVKHDTSSAVHVGECWAGTAYWGAPTRPNPPKEARAMLSDGSLITVALTGQPHCSVAFGIIEMPLRKTGSITDLKIGLAACQLMKTQSIIDRTVELLHEKEDILLCTNPDCYSCSHAREFSRSRTH